MAIRNVIVIASSVIVLIPAFNVAGTIAHVIRGTQAALPAAQVVVIDDGSQDDTSSVVENFEDVVMIRHEHNQGKGAALQSGLAYALNTSTIYAVAFLDGDGQHKPEELPRLLDALYRGEGSFIIGRRSFKIGLMPIQRIISNVLTSFLLSMKTGSRIFDSQSGYRVIDGGILRRIWPLKSTGYEFETEVLIKAMRNGACVFHVPITTIYGKENSHIRGLRDTFRFIRLYLTT